MSVLTPVLVCWGELMDGSSLATVESATLTQGVAFLYAQAGELLQRRREARDRAAAARAERVAEEETPSATPEVVEEASATTPEPFPPLRLPGNVFESVGGEPSAGAPARFERLADRLIKARREVDDYVVGMAALGGDSQAGLQAANRLRCLLEEVYDAVVTFRGEQRMAGGTTTTYVQAQHVGVAGTNIHAKYVAGHDIHLERE
jgi:hypothetical protein